MGTQRQGIYTHLEVREDFLEKAKLECECEYDHVLILVRQGNGLHGGKEQSQGHSGMASLAVPLPYHLPFGN